MTPERIQDIFDRLRKFSDADEMELNFIGVDATLTRFANNTIHQNVAEQGVTVNVRLAFDGKTASASTTATSSPDKAAIHTRDLSTTSTKKSVITGRADKSVESGQACSGS